MSGSRYSVRRWLAAVLFIGGLASVPWAQSPTKPAATPLSQGGEGGRFDRATVKKFAAQYCTSCHNAESIELKSGSLNGAVLLVFKIYQQSIGRGWFNNHNKRETISRIK